MHGGVRPDLVLHNRVWKAQADRVIPGSLERAIQLRLTFFSLLRRWDCGAEQQTETLQLALTS